MSLPDSLTGTTVAVLGGTGPQGRGLARRFAAAGLPVVIGSRSAERAAETAADPGRGDRWPVTGADNAGRRRRPATSSSWPCRGTATVTCCATSPPRWPARSSSTASTRWASTSRAPTRCRSRRARRPSRPQALLPDSTVVGAFHNVSRGEAGGPGGHHASTPTCWCSARRCREATDLVQDLAGTIPGVRGVYGGRLRNAHQVEALTANLISVNRRYKAHAGLRITDI